MLTIAVATPADVGAVADLLDELDRFYGAPSQATAVEDRTAQIKAMLFAEPAVAHALLARQVGHPVGMASYSFLWPAVGLTHSLFLKELYVREAHRHQGVGRALVKELCRLAKELRCSRVEWMTETNNTGARRFYEQLGVEVNTEKIVYRLEAAGIAELAT